MDVVGEAADGAEAQRLADAVSLDVVLMDLLMLRVDSTTAIQRELAEMRALNPRAASGIARDRGASSRALQAGGSAPGTA